MFGGVKLERNPPVAIGLPVYNGGKYLAESIESVLAQDLGDFDFLISDNCSTDSTWEICNHYAAKDKRIRLNRNHKNLGAIRNFELVVEKTHSPYFMWHAHDDFLSHDYIYKCYHFLLNNPEYVLCGANVQYHDEHGNPLDFHFVDTDLSNVNFLIRGKAFLENMSHLPYCLFYGLIRRNAILQGPWTRSVGGVDFILLFKLLQIGYMKILPEMLSVRLQPRDQERAKF